MNLTCRTLAGVVAGGLSLATGHAALTSGLAYSAFNIPNPDAADAWITTEPAGAVPNTSTAWSTTPSIQGGVISDGGLDTVQTGAAAVWNRIGATSIQDGAAQYVTLLYRGWLYDSDGLFSFAENIDDNVQIKIDGTVVLLNNQRTQDGAWQAVTSSTSSAAASGSAPLGNTAWAGLTASQQAGNFGAGWHLIEVRLGEYGGTGGPHAMGQGGSGWTPTFGFGVAGLNNNPLPTGADQFVASQYGALDVANVGLAPDGGPALRYDNADPTGNTNIIVPEPAGLALLLGGLGVGALRRRRRRG
jgi:hypothetical protein